jgi:hypothetical protein
MFSHTEPSRTWEKDKLSNAQKTAQGKLCVMIPNSTKSDGKGKDRLEARHGGRREEMVVQGKGKGKGKG